ncbi:hypothetical protein S83_052197, partial [Arachis hypogaea]
EKNLLDGYLDTKVDWIPAMKGARLKDLPTFLRTTNPSDVMFNYNIVKVNTAMHVKGVILNTFEDLESEVLDAIRAKYSNVYSIGPLSMLFKQLSNSNTQLESIDLNLWKEDNKCLEWLDKRDRGSVVYVSFGSLVIMTPKQLSEFAWGLVNSKYHFLWVIRPNLVHDNNNNGDGKLSDEYVNVIERCERGLVLGWCQQEKVLCHASIGGFLTHCGWNSTLESICEGVPMACWPFFAEGLGWRLSVMLRESRSFEYSKSPRSIKSGAMLLLTLAPYPLFTPSAANPFPKTPHHSIPPTQRERNGGASPAKGEVTAAAKSSSRRVLPPLPPRRRRTELKKRQIETGFEEECRTKSRRRKNHRRLCRHRRGEEGRSYCRGCCHVPGCHHTRHHGEGGTVVARGRCHCCSGSRWSKSPLMEFVAALSPFCSLGKMIIRAPGTPASKIDRTPVSTPGGPRDREEKIVVTVRLRPLNRQEQLAKDQHRLPLTVFGPACLTETVYEGVKNVALSALMGINATIFAYGQTSSGKTYTMRGITEKAVNDIYKHIMN